MIRLVKYITDDGKCPYDDWFNKLKDRTGKVAISNRLDRLILGNQGDYKDLGDGVFELRLFVGPAYRVYYAWENDTIVLLLSGGTKSQQDKDVALAKKYWKQHRSQDNANS